MNKLVFEFNGARRSSSAQVVCEGLHDKSWSSPSGSIFPHARLYRLLPRAAPSSIHRYSYSRLDFITHSSKHQRKERIEHLYYSMKVKRADTCGSYAPPLPPRNWVSSTFCAQNKPISLFPPISPREVLALLSRGHAMLLGLNAGQAIHAGRFLLPTLPVDVHMARLSPSLPRGSLHDYNVALQILDEICREGSGVRHHALKASRMDYTSAVFRFYEYPKTLKADSATRIMKGPPSRPSPSRLRL